MDLRVVGSVDIVMKTADEKLEDRKQRINAALVAPLESPALDAASALLWSQEVVTVLDLPASQIGAKQRSMIGQRAVVRNRNEDGYVRLQYGSVIAWAHESMVTPVTIP